LINADVLIEMIDKDIKVTEKFINEIGLPDEKDLKHYAELVSQLNTLKSYKGIIQQQPTAYNVEKVVADLESFVKLAEDRWVNGTSNFAYQERKCWVKAIEIVKRGGVDG
jgi:hypothetical protein